MRQGLRRRRREGPRAARRLQARGQGDDPQGQRARQARTVRGSDRGLQQVTHGGSQRGYPQTAQRDGTRTQRPQDEGVPRPGQGGGGTGTRQHFVQGAEVPGGCGEVHRGYPSQPRRPPRVFQQSRVLHQAHRVQRSYEGEFILFIVWAIRLTSCFV